MTQSIDLGHQHCCQSAGTWSVAKLTSLANPSLLFLENSCKVQLLFIIQNSSKDILNQLHRSQGFSRFFSDCYIDTVSSDLNKIPMHEMQQPVHYLLTGCVHCSGECFYVPSVFTQIIFLQWFANNVHFFIISTVIEHKNNAKYQFIYLKMTMAHGMVWM